jgi:hypothetical protein
VSEPRRNLIYRGCNWIVKHPVLNAALLIGGWLFAVYTWRAGIRERELTIYFNPSRVPIVQQGSITNFSVTILGSPLKGNLSSAELQIWNAGKEPIRDTDILKPITIRMPSNEAIYQVTWQGTRDVIGFTNFGGSNGVVNLDWKILERNDGVKLQIIYNGSTHLPYSVDGVIEGQSEFRVASPKDKGTFLDWLSFGILIGITALCMFGLSKFGDYLDKAYVNDLKKRYPKWVKFPLGIVATCYAIGGFVVSIALGTIISEWIVGSQTPPFGF